MIAFLKIEESSSAELSSEPRCDLLKVDFKVNNLNCGCHVPRVLDLMSAVDGVAFAFIPSNEKTFSGLILLDPSKNSVEVVFAKTLAEIKTRFGTMKPPLEPEFTVVTTNKVSSIENAIFAAQQIQYGKITSFYNSFKSVAPFDPVKELAARKKSAI